MPELAGSGSNARASAASPPERPSSHLPASAVSITRSAHADHPWMGHDTGVRIEDSGRRDSARYQRSMRSRLARLLVILAALAVPVAYARGHSTAAAKLAAETRRHNDALVAEGYNFTQEFSFDARPKPTTVKLQLLIPPPVEAHTFTFWAEMTDGELSFQVLDSNEHPRVVWTGRKGETTVTFDAPAGSYSVEIDQPANAAGGAVFGVKGPALTACEPSAGNVSETAAAPKKGFSWPYLLFLPREVKSTHLLVSPNNTGFETEDLAVLRAAGSCQVRRLSSLATRLGSPLLVPLFPRPRSGDESSALYLHALTRASLEAKEEKFRRVDLQLMAMFDDARAALRESGRELDGRALFWGFSASGSFVNRFAMLHPERALAVAVGSPGGWPLAPVERLNRDSLDYPVGVADLPMLVGAPLDDANLRKVRWFFFLGADDENDAVPHRDSFSNDQEQLILRRFGPTPASRWKAAERLYRQRGLSARFRLYRGVAHSVTPEMDEDVLMFFERSISQDAR